MANQYINLYMNNPTAGGTDGTAVSLDGSQAAPLTFTLDATSGEAKTMKCAVRCESGYTASGDVTISFSGTNAAKWGVCATENGTFAGSLTLSGGVGNTNRLLYIRAQATPDEQPQRDESVSVTLAATVVAGEG